MPKRVLMLLSNDFAPDPRVYKEARSLVGAGCEVDLFCMARDPGARPASEEHEGIRIERFDVGRVETGSTKNVFLKARKFARAVATHVRSQKLGFDFVHAHDIDTLELGARLKRQLGVPLVYDSHEFFAGYTANDWLNRGLRFYEGRFLGAVDTIIHAASARERLFLEAHPRSEAKQHFVIENFPLLVEDFEKPRCDEITFQYQGVITPPRCLVEIVQAFGRLEKRELEAVRFDIFGAPNPHSREVERVAESLGLAHVVKLRGYLPHDELIEATRRTAVGFVPLRPTHPNNEFPASNKLYDYMAAKNAVIAQGAEGVTEIVNTLGVGVCCDMARLLSATRAIRHMLAHPDLSKMQEAGFRAHRERFNWGVSDAVLRRVYGLEPGPAT